MANIPPLQDIAVIVIVGLLILLSVTIFRKPIKLLVRLAVNTIVGFITLFIINFLGGFIGVTIGINLINAVVVGIFGLPGVGFLLIFQWLMAG